jgi:hypothetical protein
MSNPSRRVGQKAVNEKCITGQTGKPPSTFRRTVAGAQGAQEKTSNLLSPGTINADARRARVCEGGSRPPNFNKYFIRINKTQKLLAMLAPDVTTVADRPPRNIPVRHGPAGSEICITKWLDFARAGANVHQ